MKVCYKGKLAGADKGKYELLGIEETREFI